jgi:hypothetical protein
MEIEVEDHIGAAHHKRTLGRVGQRNAYRERVWDTRIGTVEMKVPRVRDSSYFPSLFSREGVPGGHSLRSYRKPTYMVFPPARWTSWSRHWA